MEVQLVLILLRQRLIMSFVVCMNGIHLVYEQVDNSSDSGHFTGVAKYVVQH